MDQSELREAVRSAIAGDEAAFASAMAAVERRVAGIASGICTRQSVAQEAVRDTYAKAWGGIQDLRSPEAFVTWVDRIAVRASLDLLRWNDETPDSRLVADTTKRSDGDPTLGIAVRVAIAKLPSHHRAVVVLYYWLDQSVPVIAETLNCSQGTVKSRLSRARDALGDALREEHLHA
jgi:RNA polymerase sigma-70 factor (ECF subfamily)